MRNSYWIRIEMNQNYLERDTQERREKITTSRNPFLGSIDERLRKKALSDRKTNKCKPKMSIIFAYSSLFHNPPCKWENTFSDGLESVFL